MSQQTAIEWATHVWNPVTGCDRVSPGCANCYALTYAGRLKAMGQEKYQRDGGRASGPGFGVTMHESELEAPARWRKPRRVFARGRRRSRMPEHVTINCASKGCFAIITMHPDDEDRLRRTHETFYCPAGHSNYFPGKTPAEKEREQLERRAERLDKMVVEWRERWEQVMHAAELLAGGVRTCPLGCGWTAARRPRGIWQGDEEAVGRYIDRAGRDLAEHLLTEHNATRKPIALLAERAETHHG